MAFWGVEVKPERSFILSASSSRARLHISQAALGIGNSREKSIVQCKVGGKSPIILCVLSPDNVESALLNLEFEEAVHAVFSVVGSRSVHLTGFYLNGKKKKTNFPGSENYEEDLGDTDTERSSKGDDDYDYNDSFINDADPTARPLLPPVFPWEMDEWEKKQKLVGKYKRKHNLEMLVRQKTSGGSKFMG
ncbi:PREDICTED: peptidyl-prolyl cis-trans isomerase FKBP43-like [Tarenaya hassleriana]|uniref:peptidyl-prolyl cis-trans isomerase FKBP43-like n=1 Tax=Tarenaya hassleriana TaxID=28532 RepID=UPI00053C51D7|nr:PREDICTED: peptidyl-prolyl cis-trans isomerase FKBP43-like [Tarenaya hassleriana]